MLTAVRSQITPMPTADASRLLSSTAGQNTPRYATNATAMAALPTQAAIQYPHAVQKPAKSPNARCA